MSLVAAILIILFVSSFSFTPTETVAPVNLVIEVVDDCEYVRSKHTTNGGIVHHAACNNWTKHKN